MRLVRMAEKGSKTILPRRLCRKHKKHTEDNKDHRKHRHSERRWLYIEEREVTGRNTG